MDEVRELSLSRPDGRVLAWTETGDEDGIPLLRIPGTPGSRWAIRADRTPWEERGLRVLTTERPGFGASTRLPGRGFLEPADDLVAVLDHLGLGRVAVTGGSGAAPHVLAIAARHPERVAAATIVAGAAPLTPGERDQMVPLNAQFHHAVAADDLAAARDLLEQARSAMLADPLAGFGAVMATAPPEDLSVMADPGWREVFARSLTEALTPPVEGWLDESVALIRRWDDIDLAAIGCSLTWYHSTSDRNAPFTAAERLVARIPGARFVAWKDAGHFAAFHKEAELLDELLERC